ncbi:MAG: hypothetical protein U0525_00870 [Patescibacteria group bacterium]
MTGYNEKQHEHVGLGISHEGEVKNVLPKEVYQKAPNVPMSEDTKTLIVVLLLIFAYPIGAIVALFWPKWPIWVKILVALPFSLILTLIMAGVVLGILAALNPSEQVKRAEFMTQCRKNNTVQECAKRYSDEEYEDFIKNPKINFN